MVLTWISGGSCSCSDECASIGFPVPVYGEKGRLDKEEISPI